MVSQQKVQGQGVTFTLFKDSAGVTEGVNKTPEENKQWVEGNQSRRNSSIHPGGYPANSSVPKRRPGLDAKDTAVNRTEGVLLMEPPFCLRVSVNLGTSKYVHTFKEY